MSEAQIHRLNAALEGRYRVERQLGAGGMATVYLADDLRHGRSVAVKVLKPELAAVVGFERFLAEIRTTAHLQHPHILPLFDSGEADHFLFYVMPHAEGESLRERLDRERQLPVDDAVRIVTDVAEALEYAHAQGIVHRDIKPANILLHSGRPVVTDFGIALAVGVAGAGRLTETGLSLGTPHYMSPEQAAGDRSVGAPTDIYALGCVLYEALVGEPPYTGSTPQAILGRIIAGELEPPRRLRPSVPPHVDAAIRRALERVPADRFATARDFAVALADPGFRHAEATGADPVRGRARTGWSAAAVAAALVAGIALGRSLATSPPGADPVVRFNVPVGASTGSYLGGDVDARWGWPSATSVALSPDGALLAYSAWQIGAGGLATSRLYLRRMDREESSPITGTEGGSSPFFSPDGAWIGFTVGNSLQRVSVASGSVETISQDADLLYPGLLGASWGEDGTIVYGGSRGLYRIAASGGSAELVAEASPAPAVGTGYLVQPSWLPGRAALLFHEMVSTDPASAEIVALDLVSRERKTLLRDGSDPHSLPTGHLLFVRQGTLMAVRFDAEALAIEGEPVALLDGVAQALYMPNAGFETGAAQLAVSHTGDLAYAAGGVYPLDRESLVRVSADGQERALPIEPRRYLGMRVSPDGRRLAFTAGPGLDIGVYVHDLDRGVTQRLSTGGFFNFAPEWSPDGRWLAFSSDRDSGVLSLYRMPADGSVPPERLAPSSAEQNMGDWSPDGVIVYRQFDQNETATELWVIPPDGQPRLFLRSDSLLAYPAFSPDGRWLAYTSQETGRADVLVRPYPGPGSAVLVSSAGGEGPAWAPDGARLYYLETALDPPRRRMMVVSVDDDGRLRASRPTPLIDPWPYQRLQPTRSHDVLPDGSFVAVRTSAGGDQGEGDPNVYRTRHGIAEIHFVSNFFELVRQRLGTD